MEAAVVQAVVLAVPIIAAIVLHEVAHGWAAHELGDPTAARAGRLTLNPIPHVDPIGTIALPLLLILSNAGFLFGWARPVPVLLSNLGNPKRDGALVAAAGPVSNLAQAIFWAGILAIAPVKVLATMALVGVQFNIFLGVLNLLPVPPLDGGRVLQGLVPKTAEPAFRAVEPYGMFIMIGLLASGALGWLVLPPVRFLTDLILGNFGNFGN